MACAAEPGFQLPPYHQAALNTARAAAAQPSDSMLEQEMQEKKKKDEKKPLVTDGISEEKD